jgi:hypothetical protein
MKNWLAVSLVQLIAALRSPPTATPVQWLATQVAVAR